MKSAVRQVLFFVAGFWVVSAFFVADLSAQPVAPSEQLVPLSKGEAIEDLPYKPEQSKEFLGEEGLADQNEDSLSELNQDEQSRSENFKWENQPFIPLKFPEIPVNVVELN